MKTQLTFVLTSACLLLNQFCGGAIAADIQGSGKVVSESRKLPAFHSIELSVPCDLTCDVGTAGETRIEADDNIIPHITTTVGSDGKLLIKTDKSIGNSKKISIKTKTAKLDQFKTSGAATIVINGLAGPSFNLSSEGASTITASGKVAKFSSTLKGASKLKAAGLSTQSTSVSIAGAGDAEVNAEKDLNASIQGAGSVKYKGNPKVTKSVMGAGSIEKF